MTKNLVLGDKTFKFQIWDTAGQEKVCMSVLYLLALSGRICKHKYLRNVNKFRAQFQFKHVFL